MHRLIAPIAIAATLAACLDAGPEIETGLVPGPGGPFETTYVARDDGTALVQGDILVDLAEVDELAELQLLSATRRQRYRQWVGNVIPYEIDPSVSSSMRQRIDLAITYYNAFTPLAIKPRAGHNDYVIFTTPTDPKECSSFVGRRGGGQPINLGASCESLATIAHEIGHAAGLWHEQSRRDRDDWVVVNTINIVQTAVALAQFGKYSDIVGADYGRYDYLSIMHYHESAYSRNGQPTMTALQPVPDNRKMGTSTWLTGGDVRGLRSLYDRQTREVEIVYPSATEKCWDIPDASHANQAGVQIYPCHDGDNQRWIVQPTGDGYFELRNKKSNKCLDRANPLRLEQQACSSAATQQWVLPLTTGGSVQLVPNNVYGYTTCLEVAGSNNPNGNWLAAEGGCVSGDSDTYWWLEPNSEGGRLVGLGPGPGLD